MNPTERKIQLLNAKTLKPYIKTRRMTHLVPIFNQRNPLKTRNAIANSLYALKMQEEIAE